MGWIAAGVRLGALALAVAGLSATGALLDAMAGGEPVGGAAPVPAGAPAVQAAAAAPPAPNGPGYAWPLDAGARTVSSSFGEYRPGHFHGGIDLSTGRRIGLPVRAVDDGWVWRVRASGIGYGRSVYLRLVDGRTAVYGHLDSFAPGIAAFVEAAQESLSRYEVDLHPSAGRLPVRKGEIIGASGISGTDVPHLHFELRDREDAAETLNPFTHGFDDPDTLVPRIVSVTLFPRGAGSFVDGGTAPVTGAAAPAGVDRYVLKAVPRVTRAASIAVSACELTPAGNRRAPFQVELEVDGRRAYGLRFDEFSWERPHEVDEAFVFRSVRQGDRSVLHLFRPEGVNSPVFGDFAPLAGVLATDGREPLAPGRHEIVIRATDVPGPGAREAVLSFAVDLAAPAEDGPAAEAAGVSGDQADRAAASTDRAAGAAGAGGSAGGRPRNLSMRWACRRGALDVTVESPGWTATEGRLLAATPVGTTAATLRVSGARELTASLDLPQGLYDRLVLSAVAEDRAGNRGVVIDTLRLLRVDRGDPAALRWHELTLTAPEKAFFGAGLVTFSHLALDVPGLEPVGGIVQPVADDPVLDRPVRVAMSPPAGADLRRAGLYRLDDGEWTWLGAEAGPDGLGGDTRRLSAFGLFRDTTPPRIAKVTPAPATRVTTGRPAISAALSDGGSGFDWRGIEVTLDGVTQIVIHDPIAGGISGRSRRELSPGTHVLRIRVRDRAGNEAAVSSEFQVARAAEPKTVAPRRSAAAKGAAPRR